MQSFDQFFITQTILQRAKKQLQKKPWVLLLGPSGSGKTSLLAHSGLKLVSLTAQSLTKITPTKFLEVWESDNALFFDTAGDINTDPNIWQNLMKLCRRLHHHGPFDYIIITFNIADLKKNNSDSLLLQRLSYQLLSLTKKTEGVRVAVIVTQCDQLLGFNDYFDNLSAQEKQQDLGIDLFPYPEKNLQEHIEQQLTDFIHNISSRLIWRLQHEQSQQKRYRIKDFPFEMQQIMPALQQNLSQLPWGNKIQLDGIYFTANLMQNSSQTLPVAVRSAAAPFSYYSQFVKYRMQRIVELAHAPLQPSKTKNTTLRWLAAGVAFLFIGGYISLWHYTFLQATQVAIKTQVYLQSLSPSSSSTQLFSTALPSASPISTWLTPLQHLQLAIQDLHHIPITLLRLSGFSQVGELQQTIMQRYQKILTTDFQNYLAKTLITTLQKNIQRDNTALYSALRTYLMTTTQNNDYSCNAIRDWFQYYWQQTYASQPRLQQELLLHLTQLLKITHLHWAPNFILIAQAQKKLKQLPTSQLILLELAAHYPTINVSIVSHPQLLTGLDLQQAIVPLFYSATYFNDIYNKAIPAVAKQLKTIAWVIGETPNLNLPQNQLIAAIQKLYLQSYANHWRAALNHIYLQPPSNFTQLNQAIDLLQNQHSILYQLVRTAVDNVLLPNKMENQPISQDDTDFIFLRNFISLTHSNPTTTKVLQTAANYLNGITQAADSLQASFNATKLRFTALSQNDPLLLLQQYAQQAPAPIQQWLQTLTDSSTQLLLQSTRTYLNRVWQAAIYPEYQQQINQRYPVFADGQNTISFAEFTHFFGPHGILQSFFENYLQPFVNMKGNYWLWKKMDGSDLGIPQATLNMLLRASLIQQMFYVDNHNSPSFRFQVAIAKAQGLDAVHINLGGQETVLNTNDKQMATLQWPGTAPDQASISLISDPHRFTLTENDLWGWLRLLQNHIKTSNDPRLFYLTFGEAQQNVTLKVVADNVMNPYLPNILQQFRCPASL